MCTNRAFSKLFTGGLSVSVFMTRVQKWQSRIYLRKGLQYRLRIRDNLILFEKKGLTLFPRPKSGGGGTIHWKPLTRSGHFGEMSIARAFYKKDNGERLLFENTLENI
jgi:hypothetical protein